MRNLAILPLARVALGALFAGEDGKQARAMTDLFESLLLRGEVDLPVTVQEVRLNSGPPGPVEEGWTR